VVLWYAFGPPMTASLGDGWNDLGRCRFSSAKRTIESESGFQPLGQLEARLIELLVAESGGLLTAEALQNALWPNDKSDPRSLRQRLDSLLVRLGKKLSRIGLENLIENRHGDGYRIAFAAAQMGFLEDVPAMEIGQSSARTKHGMPMIEFARRLSVSEADRLLEPYCRMTVQSSQPIELYKGGYDRLIGNLRHGVRVLFLKGGDDPDAVGRLARCLLEPSLRQMARSSSSPARAPNITAHRDDDDWNLILNQVRIVVLPFYISPDHLYVLNSNSTVNAQLYSCDHETWLATCRERGLNAYRHGECFHQFIPQGEETLISFSPHCANPALVREDVRAAVLHHIDSSVHVLLDRVLPQAVPPRRASSSGRLLRRRAS